MAPTTRSTAASSTATTPRATKKKAISNKGKATASATVKNASTKKITKVAKKKTSSDQSPKYPQLPTVTRSPSTAATTGQSRYHVPGAYSPVGPAYQPSPIVKKNGMFGDPQLGVYTATGNSYEPSPMVKKSDMFGVPQLGVYTATGNSYEPSPMVNKYGLFGDPQLGVYTPTGKTALNWEKKSKRGYFPTRYELQRFIGPDGRPLHELQSKFARQIRHHGQLFWEICLGIASIDKGKRPFRVFLRDDVKETTPQLDRVRDFQENFLSGVTIPESTVPLAGPSGTEKKAKKSSFAKGKNKSKDYRWQSDRGVNFPSQVMMEQAALRGENTFGSIPFWSPVPARTHDGYAADIDTPRTPTSTPVVPSPSHKGKEKATSPGLANPYKITVAAKSRRDANRVVKRQQLVQRGCTELKGLIQTLKDRLVYFETLFERCAEGVDWETAELDLPEVQGKRLRFAE